MGVEISVLMPAYNEAENLVEVIPATAAALDAMGRPWEILVVDDGSTDGTRSVMAGLRSPNVRCIRLRRNAGKSAALAVGLAQVEGEFVVLMDADGQDDPAEMPKMIAALEDRDLDLVTGRRAIRNDRFVKRNTSRLYNGVTAKVSGVEGRDFNSGYKAMRRELSDSLEMYGELVEKVWGDDLRIEGVVVEFLGGVDDLADHLKDFRPGPNRRVGVLVDHLVPGSKESRIADAVMRSEVGKHVLIVGHPFIDVWQAVKPERLGFERWPDVPRHIEWKKGTCQQLGWPHRDQADIARAWKHILGGVRGFQDLDPALLGRVEELIDFVTVE